MNTNNTTLESIINGEKIRRSEVDNFRLRINSLSEIDSQETRKACLIYYLYNALQSGTYVDLKLELLTQINQLIDLGFVSPNGTYKNFETEKSFSTDNLLTYFASIVTGNQHMGKDIQAYLLYALLLNREHLPEETPLPSISEISEHFRFYVTSEEHDISDQAQTLNEWQTITFLERNASNLVQSLIYSKLTNEEVIADFNTNSDYASLRIFVGPNDCIEDIIAKIKVNKLLEILNNNRVSIENTPSPEGIILREEGQALELRIIPLFMRLLIDEGVFEVGDITLEAKSALLASIVEATISDLEKNVANPGTSYNPSPIVMNAIYTMAISCLKLTFEEIEEVLDSSDVDNSGQIQTPISYLHLCLVGCLSEGAKIPIQPGNLTPVNYPAIRRQLDAIERVVSN